MGQHEIQTYQGAPPPLALSEVRAQVNLIQEIMREVMKEGDHYGVIPGTTGKPSLLKPGAEKIIMTFRLVPDPQVDVIDLPNEHREYRVRVALTTQNGVFLGAGVGSCATMEGKYRFRTGPSELTANPVPKEYWDIRRENPAKAQAILGGKGFTPKKDDNGMWVIAIQGAKVEHENPADYYNTCLKMAKKRALVDACLTVTAASDIFSQDLDDDDIATLTGKNGETPAGKEPIKQPAKKQTNGKQEPLTAKGNIEDVTVKSGTGAKGEWTRYGVRINGVTYGTFDAAIGDIAEQYKGYDAVVSYTADGKYNTIVELVPILDQQ
jgi:hypothetical protein